MERHPDRAADDPAHGTFVISSVESPPDFATMHVFCTLAFAAINDMIEINPITNRIADLVSRVASLRGYL